MAPSATNGLGGGTNGLGDGTNRHESHDESHANRLGSVNGNALMTASISDSSIPSHPLGVRPLGNQYLSGVANARDSLGTLQSLPDEMLALAFEYLDQQALKILGYTCKFMFAFCHAEDFWKALFIESPRISGKVKKWRGSWRSTLLGFSDEKQINIDCSNVFSDVLHRPFVCRHLDLNRFASSIPGKNQIRRFQDLSYQEFANRWSNTPFILTNCIRSWPVYHTWDLERLLKMYSNVEFRAEAVDWPFSTYHDYMLDNQDESPLYLFDRKFAEKMNIRVGREKGSAYWKPECFGPDLFELLGDERPAHRWLIIGPERSGSTFHKDPNGTSAWNAVIEGAKYWIMFPPTVSVPGVYVSRDSSEVTSPLSIAEWLLEFHTEARELPECVEGICRAGEILHVPSGWWHLVVNLERGIALTQNFVSKVHLADVLSFLKDKPDQVTGFSRDVTNPHQLFVNRLMAYDSGLLEEALHELDRREGTKKRRWDLAIGNTEEEHRRDETRADGFSFGFGDDDGEVP